MWENNDKNNYLYHRKINKGQVSDDEFASDIERCARNPELKTFLEIGTWNGLGSTRAFINGLKDRNDDYVFYSLECNKEKHMDAAILYKSYKNVHILNEVIWNEEPEDFYEIFPQCKLNPTYRHWHEVDIENMKSCNLFLERKDLPQVFDVILLDGGEFTTYHEFQKLKNRCKYLMLDDINVEKCKLIVKEIMSDPSWRILKKRNVRNGYLIAEKIKREEYFE
jgi:hypothetical protein